MLTAQLSLADQRTSAKGVREAAPTTVARRASERPWQLKATMAPRRWLSILAVAQASIRPERIPVLDLKQLNNPEQIEALGNHGLRALPSNANFVLVVFEGALAAETALQAIAAAGYAVRHLPGQGLPQALRITIGTSAQMDEIAAVLRGLCGAQA